jgi:4-amino-4-deoxy-L-arabinose transferase-like glycosyltransferase
VTDVSEDEVQSPGDGPVVAPVTPDDAAASPVGDVGAPAGEPGPVPWSRRLQVWRSPDDQPAWARPLLLAVTVLAALAYSWRIGSTIEIFYAAAVRSMSQNWHNFVFGAFDPAGTVTVDKLPGALWVQALSVRLFGFNVWSLILPQALEGALTVLVLYHAVRRLAGPVAAIIAAVVLAASPATVTLNRGNIPDTLMILLVVLAADSTITAIRTGRWRSVIMAGVWVALAFQAKMLEAWLILPALGLAYLLAGRGDLWARFGRIVALGAVALVLSLGYITFVSLTPSSQRPYVDGTTNNSIWHQVFEYNGFSRAGQPSPDVVLEHTLHTTKFLAVQPPPKIDRLFTSYYGRDTGWLLPAAVVAAAGILLAQRRKPRTDLWRAGAVLWGTWLVVLGVAFTFSTTMNSYYAGALSPPVGALLGIGGVLAWERRREPIVLLVTAGTAFVTALYAAKLVPHAGTGLPSGNALRAAVVLLGVVAAAVLCWSAWRRAPRSAGTDLAAVGCVLAGLAIVFVPAVASASVVSEGLGPFDTPFQPTAATAVSHAVFAPTPSPPGLAVLETARRGAPWLMAAQTSAIAAPYIYATGEETLPLGGFTGTFPTPTVAQISSMIRAGKFHVALVASPGTTPAAGHIAATCIRLPQPRQTGSLLVGNLKIYYCAR